MAKKKYHDTKLTQDTIDKIAVIVQAGLSPERAANSLRIPLVTFKKWLRDGRKLIEDRENGNDNKKDYYYSDTNGDLYVNLVLSIEEAKANLVANSILPSVYKDHVPKSPQMALKLLERLDPDLYADVTSRQITIESSDSDSDKRSLTTILDTIFGRNNDSNIDEPLDNDGD